MSTPQTVNLKEKFSLFSDHWKQRIIGELNDSQVKIVKIQGEFVWHHHDNEDELFLVIKGTLRMKFRDHEERVSPGDSSSSRAASSTARSPTKKSTSC